LIKIYAEIIRASTKDGFEAGKRQPEFMLALAAEGLYCCTFTPYDPKGLKDL